MVDCLIPQFHKVYKDTITISQLLSHRSLLYNSKLHYGVNSKAGKPFHTTGFSFRSDTNWEVCTTFTSVKDQLEWRGLPFTSCNGFNLATFTCRGLHIFSNTRGSANSLFLTNVQAFWASPPTHTHLDSQTKTNYSPDPNPAELSKNTPCFLLYGAITHDLQESSLSFIFRVSCCIWSGKRDTVYISMSCNTSMQN